MCVETPHEWVRRLLGLGVGYHVRDRGDVHGIGYRGKAPFVPLKCSGDDSEMKVLLVNCEFQHGYLHMS